ncbi:MAG TPA: hypothetical protein VGD36_02795 [Xanthobacteraceae bacterium]|jgi:hypothetical protein
MELDDLTRTLEALPTGESVALPYDQFEKAFPPGIEDDAAKMRCHLLATQHGCHVVHTPARGTVSLIKGERAGRLGRAAQR